MNMLYLFQKAGAKMNLNKELYLKRATKKEDRMIIATTLYQ